MKTVIFRVRAPRAAGKNARRGEGERGQSAGTGEILRTSNVLALLGALICAAFIAFTLYGEVRAPSTLPIEDDAVAVAAVAGDGAEKTDSANDPVWSYIEGFFRRLLDREQVAP